MTRAEEIRRHLADDIVSGRLAPGAQLEEVELARAFGVSRTPVREAIRQLEAAGFALSRPRRGAVVASIAAEQLAEMFAVMAELEAVCARLAADHMSSAEHEALDRVRQDCADAVAAEDIAAYLAANDRFHDLVYAASHNAYLEELTRGVRRRVAPFRHAQFYTAGRLAKSLEEHEQVAAALRARDGEAAGAAMRAHILKVERSYRAKAGAFAAG
jgi:DNA-binding GntR family transcriptional regulator